MTLLTHDQIYISETTEEQDAAFDEAYDGLVAWLDEWHNSHTEAERAQIIAEFKAAYGAAGT